MFFYAFISYFLGPFLGQKWKGNQDGVQIGMLGGIFVSIALWFLVGRKYVFEKVE
jgi:Na+/proline symporter